jgi:O-antigen/teichoic acid export membrane protein
MRTDLGSDPRTMARGAAVNLVSSVIAIGVGFLFTYVLAQLVPARDIGFLAIATALIAFATIPTLLGVETGVIRFVARGAAVDDELAARGSLQVAIAIVTVTSVAMTTAIWWQAPSLTEGFFHKPEATELVRLVALSLPGVALGRVTTAALRGFGMMAYSAWLGVVGRTLDAAMALSLLAVGFGVEGVAVAAVVTAFLGLGAALVLLARVHPRTFVPARGAWHLGSMLRFSLPQTIAGAFFHVILWVDTLLLARFQSAAEVGIYAIVTRLIGPATLVTTAVGNMFAPRIAAEDARGDRTALSIMLKRVTYWNTAVSIPFFATLVLIPEQLLALFGSTYRSGATALAILAVGQLLNTAAGPLGQVINMSGRPYVTMMNNALVAAIHVGACLVLIPRYGMVGAAAAAAGALTLVNVIKLVQVRMMLGMHPFRPDSLRTFAAAGIAIAVAAPVTFLLDWRSVLWQAVAVSAVVFLVYMQAMRALGLNEEDRELFAAGRARIGRLRIRASR